MNNEEQRDLDRRGGNSSRDSLVERLDPALGEASSGIGVLLSELVRRTLRGGVAKIEEEMHDFVEEKVEHAVELRMPEFQEAATRTAETKARDIARSEVETVGREARESALRLEQEARAAAERLAAEIAETARRAEEKARTITQEAVVVVEQESKSAAEKLTGDIAETERRAEARARELVAQHVEELKQKSKSTYLQVRESLDELANRAAGIEAKLTQERQARDGALAQMRQSLDTTLQQQVSGLQQVIEQLNRRNVELEARIAELEKPRGFFGKLFSGKKKKKQESEAPQLEAPAETPEQATEG